MVWCWFVGGMGVSWEVVLCVLVILGVVVRVDGCCGFVSCCS